LQEFLKAQVLPRNQRCGELNAQIRPQRVSQVAGKGLMQPVDRLPVFLSYPAGQVRSTG